MPVTQRLSKGGRGTQGPARLRREEARAQSWQRRGPGLSRLPGKRRERAVARPAGPKRTSGPTGGRLLKAWQAAALTPRPDPRTGRRFP